MVGFICKYVFIEYFSCVIGLVVVGREVGYNIIYLVRFICNVKCVIMFKFRWLDYLLVIFFVV